MVFPSAMRFASRCCWSSCALACSVLHTAPSGSATNCCSSATKVQTARWCTCSLATTVRPNTCAANGWGPATGGAAWGASGSGARLGIALVGSSYDEKWLIVDLLGRSSALRHAGTWCDPARPVIRLPGPQGTLRYEFMLHAGEDPEQVLQEENVRRWIHARHPADARLAITRKVVYAFHARVAERWQSGRVLLAGDAAHLTPPFAGQGMNSGVRDAANLAWKLAAVVRGEMAPGLLATYAQERKPHAWSLIGMAVRIGRFMQPKSVLAALLAQGALRLCSLYPPVREHVLQLRFKPRPRFHEGFFLPGESAAALVPAGQLLPQPQVELPGGARVALDDMLGPGFAWLGLADAAVPPDFGLPCHHLRVVAQQDDFLPMQPARAAQCAVLRDVDGTLERLLRSAGANAVLLRPDRYVLAYLGCAGAPDAARLQPLAAWCAPPRKTLDAQSARPHRDEGCAFALSTPAATISNDQVKPLQPSRLATTP